MAKTKKQAEAKPIPVEAQVVTTGDFDKTVTVTLERDYQFGGVFYPKGVNRMPESLAKRCSFVQ